MAPHLSDGRRELSLAVSRGEEYQAMNRPQSNPMDRREFLQAGIVATAATTGLVADHASAQESKCRQGQVRRLLDP